MPGLYSSYLSKSRTEEIVNVNEVKIQIPEKHLSPKEALSYLVNKVDGYWMLFAAGNNTEYEGGRDANLFATPFGRDALVQLKMLKKANSNNANIFPLELLDPQTAQTVSLSLDDLEWNILGYLASKQGLVFNSKSEEEEGKIMHEHRDKDDSEYQILVARGWEFPYYGSIDATLEYILAIKSRLKNDPNFLERIYQDKNDKTQTFGHSLELAKKCLINWLNQDPETGLLYYKKLNPIGVEVQSWRDSEDAISTFKDGIKPNFNKLLAIKELQILAYEALIELEEFEKAKKLQISFFKEYLCALDDGGIYLAMAIQDGVKFDAISSANLAVLDYSIFDGYENLKTQIIETVYPKLISDNNFTKNCIVSLSPDSNRYHPAGYHTGNIWLFDNVNCALGLINTNKKENVLRAKLILDQVINICKSVRLYPELVAIDGYTKVTIDVLDKQDSRHNRITQPGQPLQGWTVSAVILANKLLSEIKTAL